LSQGIIRIEGISIRIYRNALANVSTVSTVSIVGICGNVATILKGFTDVRADLLLSLFQVPIPRRIGGNCAERGQGAFGCSEIALRELRNGTSFNGCSVHPATTDFSARILTVYELVKRAVQTGLLKSVERGGCAGWTEETLRFLNNIYRSPCNGIDILKSLLKLIRSRIGTICRNESG
jgi:hypothetical protein